MKQEKYQPIPEEVKKAEDMLTSKEKALSDVRKRETKGFQPINLETIDSDFELKEFLFNASVSRSKKGDGVFISGARGTDTSKFRKYGIPVPGCLIISTREDVVLEVNRISMLVNTLRQEIQEKEREAYKQKQELEIQESERIAKEAKEKLITEYQKACEEFPELDLKIEDEQYHQKILDSKGRAVWGLNYTIEGYLRTSGKSVDDFRDAAKLESEIRDFRNNNLQRVIDLNNLALKNKERKISPQNWEGREAGQYSQNQSDYYAISHSLYFDKVYKWTESDISNLEKVVKEKISDIQSQQKESLERLKSYPVQGSSVIAKDAIWSSSKGSFSARIEINGEVISFPTFEDAKEAETWALKNGAFLPYHHVLGEKFRDRAKSKNWDERKSKIALAILQGAIPEIRTYSFITKRPDRKGGGEGTASAEGLFIKDIHLGDGSGDLDKFAIKFFIETNPTQAGSQQLPDLDTASREVLETYVRKSQEEKKFQEESARTLALTMENEKLETRAKKAGTKYGYEFIGIRDQDGIKEFGFIINRGTAGWRIRQRLKDPNMLSGKLSTGWKIWVKEEDLDDLEKLFVQQRESREVYRTLSEKLLNNPFQDFFKK